MSLNGYSYVEGNPVNWTDPSGMQHCDGSAVSICRQGNEGGGMFVNPRVIADWIVDLCVAGLGVLGLGTLVVNPVTDDAVPIPFPIGRIMPDNYSKRFDVALGISEHLARFAFSFTDYPTVYFDFWPEWMLKDGKGEYLPLKSPVGETVAAAIISALTLWSTTRSRGIIKFNLEGVREVDPDFGIHGITLMELRNLLGNLLLLPITKFYRFETGVPRELLDTELAQELALIVPLFARL